MALTHAMVFFVLLLVVVVRARRPLLGFVLFTTTNERTNEPTHATDSLEVMAANDVLL